jgi:hypothetical protein
MIFINPSIWRSRQTATAVCMTKARSHRWPEQEAHYIEVAAPCKRGGVDFPGIPQLKLQ